MFVKFISGNNVKTKPEANMACNGEDVFIVDSVCTEYITRLLIFLENKRSVLNVALIVIPNGHAIPVEEKGGLIIPGGAKLKGALYVPNFKYNLLPISRLSKYLQYALPSFLIIMRSRSLIQSGKFQGGCI